jgi:hypothetical protein
MLAGRLIANAVLALIVASMGYTLWNFVVDAMVSGAGGALGLS